MNLDDLINSQAACITRTDLASLFDCDERTVSRAIADGQLPAVHIGRRVLIPRLKILELLGVPVSTDADAAGPQGVPASILAETPVQVPHSSVRAPRLPEPLERAG